MGRRIFRRVHKNRAKDDRVQKKPSTADRHPLMELHRSIGSNAVQRLIDSPYIQSKLQVSSPVDEVEDEAEKTSDAVMRSTDGATAIGSITSASSVSNQTGRSSGASQSLQNRLTSSSSSSPLPDAVREFM